MHTIKIQELFKFIVQKLIRVRNVDKVKHI